MYPDIPVVTTCHGTELRQLDLVPALRDFVVPACSQIDRVMALHQNLIDKIHVSYGIDKSMISLVGAGYRDDIFCSPETGICRRDKKDTLTIVYAGKLSFAKGLPWLIETADRLTTTGCGIVTRSVLQCYYRCFSTLLEHKDTVSQEMGSMEIRVKSGLREHGITCHSVYRMPGDEEGKLVMAFPARDNSRLTTSKVEHAAALAEQAAPCAKQALFFRFFDRA